MYKVCRFSSVSLDDYFAYSLNDSSKSQFLNRHKGIVTTLYACAFPRIY